MKGLYSLDNKFKEIGFENCYISEITLAELRFGVENSQKPEKNEMVLNSFLTGVQILPIIEAINIYAKEKASLRKSGNIIDDFDLLIAATSLAFGLIMVSNNVKHFKKVKGIKIEDWTVASSSKD
jgi:tRNA(fMet)-specific endonuclease VapC